MQTPLFFVGMLLTAAAEIQLDARIAQRDYGDYRISDHDAAFYAAREQCSAAIQTACSRFEPSFLGQNDVRSRLDETDLGETCSYLQQYSACAWPSFESNQQCQLTEQLNANVRPLREFLVEALDFVCVENFDVINGKKSCLLKVDQHKTSVLIFKLMMSCSSQWQRSVQQAAVSYCISVELQQCAKNVIAAECGQDIATVASDFADKTRAFCRRLTLPPSSERSHGIDHLERKLAALF